MKNLLIAQDKANHIVWGFIAYFIANLFIDEPFSFLAVCVLGAGKEFVHDHLLEKGTPDYKDFLCTIVAGFLLLLKSIIF